MKFRSGTLTLGRMMKINKSTRHAKIAGDFGETIILCWLSKFGFECAPVDHTSIDIMLWGQAWNIAILQEAGG
jgi:hypothetical protein